MSPLVMFNHLLFVNTFPARSLSQSAPGPPRDPEAESIPTSFLALPLGLEGGAPLTIQLKAAQSPEVTLPSRRPGEGPVWSWPGARTFGWGCCLLRDRSQRAPRLATFLLPLVPAVLPKPLLSPHPGCKTRSKRAHSDPYSLGLTNLSA